MSHTTATPQAAALDIDRIVHRYVAVWSEPDPAARERAVADLWAPDGVEFVEAARFPGHAALADRIAHAHEAFVATGDYRVTHHGRVTVHGDIVMFTIQLTRAKGPAADQVAFAARVFLLLTPTGRIHQDYHLTTCPLPQP